MRAMWRYGEEENGNPLINVSQPDHQLRRPSVHRSVKQASEQVLTFGLPGWEGTSIHCKLSGLMDRLTDAMAGSHLC
ncbi:hypothetical protein AAFF_G00162310 [Aldrovandia affinis]|uniref:Uncharacterized protein n=1 Tax=Aldrovandia affinis TaxID=143900 RepID=A0AAD7SZT1_9TELE|nr:hypothetical protein AAFF_G00162310 [Aldrovandia affinis]